MMYKLQMPIRRSCWITVNSLICLLFILLIPIQAADIRIKNYVVPVFPNLLNRAGVQALYIVEFSVTEGRVDSVKVVFQRIMFPDNRIVDNGTPFNDFVKSINDALTQWQFEQVDSQKTYKVKVNVKFLLGLMDTEHGMERYSFTVQEKDHMPSEVTVEAERILPDIIKN